MTEATFNIPIYRAKRIDTEEYIKGFLYSPTPSTFYILTQRSGSIGLNNEIIIEENEYFEIDPSTLAISTKREDKKEVFEAINENGIGGDMVLLQELDLFRNLKENTRENVAILNTDWSIFYDYGNSNGSKLIKTIGIKS